MDEQTNRERYLATLRAELETAFKTFVSHSTTADKQFLHRVLVDHSSGPSDQDLSLVGAFMVQLTGSTA